MTPNAPPLDDATRSHEGIVHIVSLIREAGARGKPYGECLARMYREQGIADAERLERLIATMPDEPEITPSDDADGWKALATALESPGPNVEGCTCNRDDITYLGLMTLCPQHKKCLGHCRWEILAFMVVDLEAALANIKRAALAAYEGKGSGA